MATASVRPTTISINLSSLDGSNGFRLDDRRYYSIGSSIGGAGDINGDGFDDIAIGRSFEKYYEGSYVVFGKASGFDASMDLLHLGGEDGFQINVNLNYSSVSGVGDINGDGFNDLVVIEETRERNYGSIVVNNAYVVFGKATGFGASLNLSSLDGSNGFRLEGGTEHEFLGISVGRTGDVSGDGFDDFIVNSYDNPSYVVFGKSSGFDATLSMSDIDGSNGFRLDGAGGGFATRIGSIGDINGDGFDDVIVSAVDANYVVFGKASGFDAAMNLSDLDGNSGFRLDGAGGFSDVGDINNDGFDDLMITRSSASYVVFGKSSGFDAAMDLSKIDGSNGFVFINEGGFTFNKAGDVNGDGFDDLIIGNGRADPNGDDSGSTYVMFGKALGFDAEIRLSDLDGSNSVRFNGESPRDLAGFGRAAGDVNGDGFDDLMIGTSTDYGNSFYVIFGASQFTGTVTYVGVTGDGVATGTAAAEHFDPSNGNDLLIGGGGADVIYGGSGDDIIRVPDLDFQRVDGGRGNDTLGLDGGGINLDLIDVRGRISGIETIDLSGNGNNTLTLTTAGLLALPSDTPGTLIVKGDAGDEIAVRGNRWVDGGLQGGVQGGFHMYTKNGAVLKVDTAVRVNFLDAGIINLSDLDGNNGFRLDGVAERDSSGSSVSNAGDVNGDGFDDLIIGAPHADSNGILSGSSYVVFGKSSGFDATMNLSHLDGNNGFRLDGGAFDRSGNSVSAAGDVNGDGFDDLIIGAPNANPNGGYYSGSFGSSYVVFGKSSGFDATMNLSDLDGSNGFRLDGEAAYDSSGSFVSNAGDVNGDGFDDVIIGAFRAEPNGDFSGSSYVVFGRLSGFDAAMNLSGLDGSNGFRLDGVAKRDFSGNSVSSAGDVNGDGFDDVIIGAHDADPNGDRSGSSYVVFGRASGFDAVMNLSGLDGSNGFRLDGEAERDYSGSSVSSAGDVNGDGFGDVIIGATGADPNGDRSGSSYVVFGKASGFDATMNLSGLDGSNGFRLDGEAEFNFLGGSVSGAGDVNGDGFDDLIIGSSGSSYVIFGKASGFDAAMDLFSLDGSSGFRLGEAADDFSSSSVSSAGDVNGDGFDDLIVGASRDDPNGIYSGSSYIIFGRSDFTGNDVDFPGTPGDDIFTGTKAAERFEGGAGNDRMIGRGGADWFDGGAGNDYIRISDDTFQFVDGGSGTDILGLAGSNFNLDLSSVIDKIHGIETIGLYGVGDNSLTLTAQDVIDLSDTTNTLKIKGNAGDSVVGLSSGWTDGGIRGNFHEYTQGDAVVLVGVAVTTDFPVV
ncbi:beta strand repeat-containing protein [Nitrosomonas ureae]|uniref:FG-GAP repeat-containing protein n=1 Tax=Nitrosomonas ureae TaxID=44577 RepID=A0A1H5UL33_9PROT|nr:FG-GAP-like repeat-containing protein [Nitrosomonas ureae]SEF75783.1 FG-GAP repeat-containing protein [Nitrosomonas ureae]